MVETENGLCRTVCAISDRAKDVKSKMVDGDLLLEVSNLFKVLSDHTRIRILNALSQSELCVCDLTLILEMSQSAISHQLRVLRNSRVVKYRKEGKNVFYSLDDQHIFSLLDEGLDHVSEER